MYGSKPSVTATIISGGVAAVVLPVTGGASSIVSVAASVFSGLVVWGMSYHLMTR